MIGNNHRMLSKGKKLDQNIFLTIASSVNHVLSYPEPPREGDLMFAFMRHSAVFTVSNVPSGWTQIASTNEDTRLYYKVAGASESNSYNFETSSANALQICAITYTNRDAHEPDYADVSTSTSSASNVAGLATTAINVDNGATVFAFISYAGTATSPPSANNSFVFLNGDTTLGVAALYYRRYDVAASSQSVTFTATGSNGRMRTIILEILPN